MYNTPEWKNYRFRFLHHNPLCYCCGVDATVVDHLYVHDGDVELFEATHNSVPMCRDCHNFVTSRFDAIKPQRIQEKIDWIKESRARTGTKTVIKVLDSFRKKKR